MNRHSRSTRALVEAALMIALATILGYFRLPRGGLWTLPWCPS